MADFELPDIEMDPFVEEPTRPDDYDDETSYIDDGATRQDEIPEAPQTGNFDDMLIRQLEVTQANRLPGVIDINAVDPTPYEKNRIVDHYYRFLREKGAIISSGLNPDRFELKIEDVNSHGRESRHYGLYFDGVPLSHDGMFYEVSGVLRNAGRENISGVLFLRNMGITNYNSTLKQFMPPRVEAAVTQGIANIPTVEDIPLQDLPARIAQSQEDLRVVTTEMSTNTELSINDQTLRDMERFNQQLATVRGQIEAATIKINDYNELIEQEKENAITDVTEEQKAAREDRIAELERKIEFQEKIITGYIPEVKTQFDAIRATYDKLMGDELTLGEKVRTLFREQGVTIVSVLTAIGMAISTLATSIALGVKNATPNPKPKPPGPGPDPGPDPGPTPKPTPGSKEWIKQMLQKIANLLIKLGDKALAALPGIIGAVVNFLLKSAASAVGFLAENLWALIVAIGGLLLAYVYPSPKPKSKRK